MSGFGGGDIPSEEYCDAVSRLKREGIPMKDTLTVDELENLRKWADDVYPSNERRIASGRIVQIIDTALSFAAHLSASQEREGVLREALQPFAKLADEIERCCSLYSGPESSPENWAKACQWDDLLRARAVLQSTAAQTPDPHSNSPAPDGSNQSHNDQQQDETVAAPSHKTDSVRL